MNRRCVHAQNLRRFVNRNELASGRLSRWLKSRDAAVSSQAADLIGGEAFASSCLAVLTIQDSGDDFVRINGNVYLVRPTAHPTVFVISPTGEILRELTLDTPPSSRYNLDDIGVGKGRIALAFSENKAPVEGSIAQHLFRTYDALTGELQTEYEPSKDLWGMFSCYVPPSEFTLLTPKEKTNTFLLQKATP
jgi:hypothetical protein